MSWVRPPARVKQFEGEWPQKPRVAQAVIVRDVLVAPIEKVVPKRSVKYRRWVSTLPCIECGREGSTQCAHADQGKVMATKAGDDTCFPLCVEHHAAMGSQGAYSKQDRRDREAIYGARTRLRAMAEVVFPEDWT